VVSADVSTDTGGTNLNASLKLAGSGPIQWWNLELAVQSSQAGTGTGAVFDTGDSISSGAQLSLAVSYANVDVLPATDPKVKAFLAALHSCRAFSSTKLREQVAAIQQARKAGTALEEKEQKLFDAGCTYSESEAGSLVEDARNKPFLFAFKATLSRSD